MCAHVQTNTHTHTNTQTYTRTHARTHTHTHTVDERVQIVSSVTSYTTVLLSPHIYPQHKPHLPTPYNYFAQVYSPTRGTQTREILHFLLHNM